MLELYTPKVFSALKTQAPQQAKKRFGVYQKACFQGKKEKIHFHQSAFKVVVGDPFAQYWCIDFGLLSVAFGVVHLLWYLFCQASTCITAVAGQDSSRYVYLELPIGRRPS